MTAPEDRTWHLPESSGTAITHTSVVDVTPSPLSAAPAPDEIDGIPVWLVVIIAVALTAFLIMAGTITYAAYAVAQAFSHRGV